MIQNIHRIQLVSPYGALLCLRRGQLSDEHYFEDALNLLAVSFVIYAHEGFVVAIKDYLVFFQPVHPNKNIIGPPIPIKTPHKGSTFL